MNGTYLKDYQTKWWDEEEEYKRAESKKGQNGQRPKGNNSY